MKSSGLLINIFKTLGVVFFVRTNINSKTKIRAELFLKSIVTRNIDNDDVEEILISADEMDESGTAFNKGWILIFKVKDNWPQIFKSIQVEANIAYQSLRLGDVIEGGYPEIVTPVYRLNGDTWNTLIIGWDINGEKLFEKQIYDEEHMSGGWLIWMWAILHQTKAKKSS